jgi:hypothetical protein
VADDATAEPALAAGDGSSLCAEYEQLRQVALAGHRDGWRHGLGVLAAKGMAGWMRACRTIGAPPSPTPPAATSARGTFSAVVPGAHELVTVMAAMALAHA